MIKLSDNQVEHIKDYINRCGIRYLDVRLELVDHMASAVEADMQADQIGFNQAFVRQQQAWTVAVREKFVKEKEKQLRKYWHRRAWTYIKRFFQPPTVFFLIATTVMMHHTLIKIVGIDSLMNFIDSVSEHMLWIYGIIAAYYNLRLEFNSDALIVTRGYYSSIAFLWSSVLLLNIIDSLLTSLISIPYVYSFLIVMTIILTYAGLFVFPRWLRAEVRSLLRFA